MLSRYPIYIFMLLLLFVFAENAFTQPPPPLLPGAPQQAPIDGGLALLAAAGGAFAWRKLRKSP